MTNLPKQIVPGIYQKGTQIEIDVPELLKTMGWEDTEENRDLCVEYAEKILKETGLLTADAKTMHTHAHSCPRCSKRWQHQGKRKKCGLSKQAFCPRHNS
jgi:hypothetical protein